MFQRCVITLGLSALLLSALPAMAAPPLFNTGVNAVNAQLPLGSVDPHWTVVENGNLSAFVLNNQAPGPYVVTPTALWIWQQADGNPGGVTRTLRQTFDLTGFDPTSAQITGRYATDNAGIIQLNGVTVGVASASFSAFTGFSLTTNFVAGINTLDFVTTDFGAPSALIVDQLDLKASPLSTTAPEPTTLALLALGGAIVVRRRRKL
jgi:hypothetical protein